LYVSFCVNGIALNLYKLKPSLLSPINWPTQLFQSSNYRHCKLLYYVGLPDKILDVTLNKNRSMGDHTNTASKFVRYHICALRNINSLHIQRRGQIGSLCAWWVSPGPY